MNKVERSRKDFRMPAFQRTVRWPRRHAWLVLLPIAVISCGDAASSSMPGEGPLVRIHVEPVSTASVSATLTVSALNPSHVLKTFMQTFNQGRFDLLGASFPMGTRGQVFFQVDLLGAGYCLLASGTASLDLTSDSEFDQKVVVSTFPYCGVGPFLSVQVSGLLGAGGSVSSMPNGISCADTGGTCKAAMMKGTQITLTAIPDATSVFAGWGGACSGTTRTCSVTVNADLQVSANFASPVSCEQIRSDQPTAPDGNRTLFVAGDKTKPWDAYCQMTTTPTVTYLNLTKTSATDNFAQFTVGGASTGITVKTNYTKVRIDPAVLKVDTNDRRFATSMGALVFNGSTNVTSMPYATSMACGGSNAGAANIDLTGTPFAVATGALALGGSTPTGTTTPTPNGQIKVFNLTGNGAAACGWNAPTGSSNPYNSGGSPLNLVYFP